MPQRRAIHFQGRELNYAELDRLANQLARKLMESGVKKGDSVAIFATNSPEYVAAFFGCARMGAVLAPINLMFTAEDVDFVLKKTRVKALLLEPVFAAKVSERPAASFLLDEKFTAALAEVDGGPVEQIDESEAPHLIIFTSGTTARPKGVVLTHLNFYAYLMASYADYGRDTGIKYLLALPMFHVAGLVMTFGCFASGCESVIIPLPKPEQIIQAITVHRVNSLSLPVQKATFSFAGSLPEYLPAAETCQTSTTAPAIGWQAVSTTRNGISHPTLGLLALAATQGTPLASARARSVSGDRSKSASDGTPAAKPSAPSTSPPCSEPPASTRNDGQAHARLRLSIARPSPPA